MASFLKNESHYRKLVQREKEKDFQILNTMVLNMWKQQAWHAISFPPIQKRKRMTTSCHKKQEKETGCANQRKNTIKLQSALPPVSYSWVFFKQNRLLNRPVIKALVLWFDVAFSTLLRSKAIILPYNSSPRIRSYWRPHFSKETWKWECAMLY